MSEKHLSNIWKTLLSISLLLLIGLLGVFDYFTGPEITIIVLYLIPVGLAGWYVGWKIGTLTSVMSALTWYVVNKLTYGQTYEHPLIPIWNALTILVSSILVTRLSSKLWQALNVAVMFARVDYLTGAWNRRAFHELVEIEISRLERQGYPFSILYLDVDNFKAVNDRFGHAAGDNVLKGVVAAMKRKRRPEDAVARLGGDEFAVLLSHTNDDEARNISLRIQDMLRDTVSARWPVAFSVGTITCHQPPASVYELIDKADQMMYKAKRENKKAIDRALHAEIFKAHTF